MDRVGLVRRSLTSGNPGLRLRSDNNVKVTFENVAGLEGAKEEVEEIVEFLKHPDKYTSLGGKIPKAHCWWDLLEQERPFWPKPCGEAKVPFFSLSGSDFVEMFVGVGIKGADLFKQAKDKSPAIIFIDEIDAIGQARKRMHFREATTNAKYAQSAHTEMMASIRRISDCSGCYQSADILDQP